MSGVVRNSDGKSQEAVESQAEVGKPVMEVTKGHASKDGARGGIMGFLDFLERRGDVEIRGCTPVPYDDRKETNYFKIFTLWFCLSCNPLP
jgi:hypothetical protein